MYKKKYILCAAALLAAAPSLTLSAAADPTITVEQQFTEFDSNAVYPFAEIIEREDEQYKLVDTSHGLIHVEEVDVSDTVSLTLRSDPLEGDAAYKPKKQFEEDGVVYTLISSKAKETVTKTAFESPYKEIAYFTGDSVDRIPDIKKVRIMVDGKEKEVPLKKEQTEAGPSEWVDTTIDLLYSDYNSDYYMLGSQKILHDSNNPNLAGYEGLILQQLGLSSQSYRIDTMTWNGEPYTTDGITYRNAVAKAQRLQENKVVTYSGTIKQQKTKKMTVYTDTYKGIKKVDTGKRIYTIKAVGTYELYKTNDFYQKAFTVSIALLILSILISVVIFILSRKKGGHTKSKKLIGSGRTSGAVNEGNHQNYTRRK